MNYEPMILTDEQLVAVKKLAMAYFSVTKIAQFIGVDKKKLAKIIKTNATDCPICKAYYSGILEQDYKISRAVLDMAERGNIQAQAMARKMKEKINS